MTKNSNASTVSQWTGMVPVDDTALAVTDTGGPGIPVVYLNGQFATQGYWRRVIAERPGMEWRHITYDERAGGRSKRSADYSFEAAVRDVDAVLAARAWTGRCWWVVLRGGRRGALGRPESGACAGRGPGRRRVPLRLARRGHERRIPEAVRAAELVHAVTAPDGPYPADDRGTAGPNSNIELGRLSRERELGPVLDDITVPARYAVASGTSFGSRGDEQERIRAGLDAVTVRNPNIQIAAKVAANHGAILKKDFRAIAEAVRGVAALYCGGADGTTRGLVASTAARALRAWQSRPADRQGGSFRAPSQWHAGRLGTRRRLRPPGLGGRGSLVQGGPGRSRHSGPAPTPGHRAGDAPLNQRHPGGPCAARRSAPHTVPLTPAAPPRTPAPSTPPDHRDPPGRRLLPPHRDPPGARPRLGQPATAPS
ncbi:hypothetical protein SALBM311S_12193 [Streptomyces alboniger]